eukprot:67239-Rhodomonas_salina.1
MTLGEWRGRMIQVWDLGMMGQHAAAPQDEVEKDNLLVKYVGRVGNRWAADAYEASKGAEDQLYAMRLSKSREMTIIAEKEGNVGSFINHSCQPNARAERWTEQGRQRIGIFANGKIKAKSKVTINYGLVGGVGMKC